MLLDTHALLWWLGERARLSGAAESAIGGAERPLLSAGSLIEIAIKTSLGKLEIDDDWPQRVTDDCFTVLDISFSHAQRLQELPFVTVNERVHRDPFDRLLVAQALVERVPIVTRDPLIAAYGVPVIW